MAPAASTTAPAYLRDSLPGRHGWPIGFAHRGADVTRENTLAAFTHAVNAGFSHLELDVRTTADGVLVCFHDETLDRVSTGTGPLSALTWAQLVPVRVGGEPLLRFADLLTTFPEVRFNVDLKDAAAVPAMLDVLTEHDAWDRVLIAAFQDSRRAVLRRELRRRGLSHRATGPRRLATSPGMAAMAAFVTLGPLGLTRWLRRAAAQIDCLQVPVNYGRIPVVTPGFVRRAHAARLPVHVWVIDDAAEMERLLDLGVDGIMTDRADVLAEVFTRRGIWPQR
ncbi:MAG: glycerophosphodiester phosphodiesterase [Micrococcus sp.]|nr:glycerophosphodiester phosphodiesterase [Micrococcus sp.]